MGEEEIREGGGKEVKGRRGRGVREGGKMKEREAPTRTSDSP